MEDLLKHLEVQIKSMVEQQKELRHSNQQLEHSKGSLSREKDILLARQIKVIDQIKILVSKLKAIEKPT
jgi:hypothetical protein